MAGLPEVTMGRDVHLVTSASVGQHGKTSLKVSDGFGHWLDGQNAFLSLTTMGSGLVFAITADGNGNVAGGARRLGLARGLSIDAEHCYLANNTRIVHLVNRSPVVAEDGAFDANYIPHSIHFVGDSLLHDVVHSALLLGETHEVVFVNTNYSTIAALDSKHSFRPLWIPKHVSRLAPEDRCHLNCIGIRDGAISYATVFSCTDTAEGWRVAKPGSGAVIDIASGEVICAGLTKPHSLKWHRDRLWVLNSEMGDFGYVDQGQGRFVPVTHLGNFLRGLSMIGDYAIIGASTMRGRPFRNEISVQGLTNTSADSQMCAAYVVDIKRGEVVHAAVLSGIEAVYDIAVVPGIKRPLIAKFGDIEERRESTSFDSALPAHLAKLQN
jgi:uncharacterized protein (TIGR03032 family)